VELKAGVYSSSGSTQLIPFRFQDEANGAMLEAWQDQPRSIPHWWLGLNRCGPSQRPSTTAHGSGGPFAGFGQADLESHGQGAGRWARDSGRLQAAFRRFKPDAPPPPRRWVVGGGPSCRWRRSRPFWRRGGPRRNERVSGGDTAARSVGGKVGPTVKPSVMYRCWNDTAGARSPRYPTSQSRALRAGRMEKKRFPKSWRPC